MRNDELYYDALTDLAIRISSGLRNRTEPLGELNQALNLLIRTNTINGKAADGMKAYIGEVHLTLIQALQLALNNYQMALGKYVKGYLAVDRNRNFKLVKEDLNAHVRQLTAHRSDFTKLERQLKAISSEVDDLVWLGGAGGNRLGRVATEMDQMKQIAQKLKEKWETYEQHDPGFDQVQDLIARTKSLIKQTVKVPRGYAYSPGSFNALMTPDFLNAFKSNAQSASDKANQKAFQENWQSIGKAYKADQIKIQKAAAKKKGWDNLGRDIFFLLTGALITVATGGAGAPLAAALIISSLTTAVDVASDVRQGLTGNTTNYVVGFLKGRGINENDAKAIWTGMSILAGVAGSGAAYGKLVNAGVAKGTIGQVKPIFKTAFSGSEIVFGNPMSKAVSVMSHNKTVLTSQLIPHLAEGAKLDKFAVKQIALAYGQATVDSTAKKMATSMVFDPIYDAVFEDKASDKATAKRLVELTKLSGRFAQPVFGYGR
ncbi:hypothetical protein GYN67_07280 [Lactococcus piscium]|uniref:T7SS effector LXG polymorphic toxin n=1 Tax=Pseudolactococcus carnosus TaxID=2749961 RepID=UPI001FB99867|nr:T7SS effector LXG polymorphic toxin [Lactococcus carnosus]MCJ1996489.1 hypothetical protein [Lactococcus carnosus]